MADQILIPKRTPMAAGQRYGRLVAVAFADRLGSRDRWTFQCDCGNDTVIPRKSAQLGNTKSCGCLRRDTITAISTTHGQRKSPLYRVWHSMLQRCSNLSNKNYPDYGGRGITVCDRWQSFEHFLSDMGQRPAGTTIERINNNGNYDPDNCKWVSRTDQARNRRSNIIVTYNGKEMCISEACELAGISVQTAFSRLRQLGWASDRLFIKPTK